jgi:hypothetical protein
MFDRRAQSHWLREPLRRRKNFGVVSPEDRRNVGSRFVDRLDQLRDPRWHHQEVHGFRNTSVAIGVRDAATSQNGGACIADDLVVAKSEAELPGQDVPRLVVVVVDMERRDPMIADLGFPPDDHKVIRRAAEGGNRQVH